ncbi:MAG: hypothetical protein JXB50_04550, partial [Spirochaetes bacterium]|nr:hypothetical protein [Spirochaetota bacterium]
MKNGKFILFTMMVAIIAIMFTTIFACVTPSEDDDGGGGGGTASSGTVSSGTTSSSSTLGEADYIVTITATINSWGDGSGKGIRLIARSNSDYTNAYVASYNNANCKLYRKDASSVQIGTTNATPVTLGDSHEFKLSVIGSTITSYLDTVQMCQTTDATYSDIGSCGFIIEKGTTTGVSATLTNITITTSAGTVFTDSFAADTRSNYDLTNAVTGVGIPGGGSWTINNTSDTDDRIMAIIGASSSTASSDTSSEASSEVSSEASSEVSSEASSEVSSEAS